MLVIKTALISVYDKANLNFLLEGLDKINPYVEITLKTGKSVGKYAALLGSSVKKDSGIVASNVFCFEEYLKRKASDNNAMKNVQQMHLWDSDVLNWYIAKPISTQPIFDAIMEYIELYDYDLIFLGTPVIEFLPCKPILDFIHSQLTIHRKMGNIIPSSPKIPGKYAVCYCTYSGPHTGIREAIPAVKYMEQFFEHLRFSVLGEWYIVGEFKGNEILSTKGALGDIRGRPNKEDLLEVERKVEELLKKVRT